LRDTQCIHNYGGATLKNSSWKTKKGDARLTLGWIFDKTVEVGGGWNWFRATYNGKL
jgi:hypothetical protein